MIKNLGQIAGLWVGNTSPQNRLLIWFDTGNNIHKTYDYSTGTWIPVSMNPIVNKTYAELQNLAALNSISQGTFYRITDLGYLALAITSTKIQYTDNNDNVIIDDLISTKTYCVTSSNLLIEDKGGVWDVSTNTLKFNFEDTDIANDTSATTANDYVLGTKLRNGTKKLSKYKLSSLISRVTGNAISWNKGFFLNFLTNLQSYYDVNGGVVRYTTYTTAINTINQSLTTLQQNINNLNIWNKTMPSPFNPPAIPTDMAANDTLKTLLQKAQAWINKFKNAKGIVLSSDYTVDDSGVPAIGDTVETALGKIQYETQGLPVDWVPSSTTSPNPSASAGDTFSQAIAKIQRWLNMFWNISTSYFRSKKIAHDTTSVFSFDVSGFDGDATGTFSISGSNSSVTTLTPGSINLLNKNSVYVGFIPGSSRELYEISNYLKYSPDSISFSTGTGTSVVNFYTLRVDEPNIPSIPPLSEGQHFNLNDVYAIFAKSILTEKRSSKVKMVNSYAYDINEHIGGTPADIYEITVNTPEHLLFYKTSSSATPEEPVMYINLKIASLRIGQHIGITFFNTIHTDTASLQSINLNTNDDGHAILIPTVNNNAGIPVIGGFSISVRSNYEYKFVVVSPLTLGYDNIDGLLLLCLNSPNISQN